MTQTQPQVPPLQIENLSFRYRSRTEPAISGITLSLDIGQILLVAGASGCGKTTLIRCINGLIPRSYKGDLQGSISIQGQDPASLSLAQVSQHVGTVLQDPDRQILGVRVRAEVAFGLENLGLPRREIGDRVEEALQHLDILHLADRETFLLSGGEKQKVAVAGVLAMRPQVLLLDEPLASLDPASAQEALALFRQLADEGMSIFLVEHRVEDALTIHPERVLFMKDGQVAYLGSPSGLMDVVDYHQVKLPASVIINRAASDPSPTFMPAVQPNGREPLVVFEHVSFSYSQDGPTVVHNVDLSIHQGDIIAVLGPNGAGKTTLVKHAIGLVKPTTGRVLVEGRDTQDISVAQIANTLGYVFQSPSHMLFAPTVHEELEFGPTNMGFTKSQIRQGVERATEIVNLKGLEDYAPLALSFGQQKRVSIASVLAMTSKILVMDEPTAGQDYANYRAFMNSILQMPGFQAVLFITHDLDLAVIYANRAILMREGTVAADGSPERVLADLELLQACRMVPTSLLQANLDRLERTGRFMSAEALAHV